MPARVIKITKKISFQERIAIALEDIALSLKVKKTSDELNDLITEAENLGNELYITFPEKTAKEIVDKCNNSVAGGKLLYSTWLNDEDFYTKEKCRPRTVKIPTEILHAGKSWSECKDLIGEENMFNFAEIIYMLRESALFRKLLSYPNKNPAWYTWTSSRGSDGFLALAGDFGSDGVRSSGWGPGGSLSGIGVCKRG